MTTAIPYEAPEEDWDSPEDQDTMALPGRPRRRFWGRGSALLLALVLGAIGFYVGIRVEKGQLANSSSTGSGLAAAFAAARGTSGAGGSRAASRTGGTASAARSFTGGGRGLFGGLGGGNSSFGTVSSVSGNSIYVTETGTGNVVKVSLSSATKITKSQTVRKSSINPGDTVVVQGVKGSGGTVSATSVSDSGASATGSGTTGSSGSGSAGSAVNSLFGGGGG